MFRKYKIYMMPIVGFLVLIILFGCILKVPLCNKGNLTLFDSTFLSASAISGTGYSTVVLADELTWLGQLFLILAVQIGTLGFMIFFSFILTLQKKRLKFSDTLILSNEINFENQTKVKEKTFSIIKYTFSIELIGAMLLSIFFVPKFGLMGFWYGIFHSISAFCNAGFDLLGSTSFINYTGNIYLNIILIVLMLTGGIGYFVIDDICNCIKNRKKHLQVHSKLIIKTSFFLILVSCVLFKIFMPTATILEVIFNTITARSTGFATLDFSLLSNAAKLLIIFLMFIGGASGSSSGGIRLTNFAIMMLFPIAVIKGKDIIVFDRKITDGMIRKALTIVYTYVLFLIVGFFILLQLNNNISSMDLLFELVSAFSTTGVGTIDINTLSIASKAVILVYMYLGRLGPLAFLTIFALNAKKNENIEYPSAELMI